MRLLCNITTRTPEYESVGQLAVDFIDSQRKLAERAISEAMLLVQEAQPPPPNGGKASHSTRHIDLYEFFTMCELFYDTTPEVKVSLNTVCSILSSCRHRFSCVQDDVLYFEKLFLPAGSYELLPDDNLVTAGHSDGESMTTATATTK